MASQKLTRSTGKKSDEISKYRIDFIDPLFAVAIHIGIVEGLLADDWYEHDRIPNLSEALDVLFFGLALYLLVSSWVGYHLSIHDKPLRRNERFVLDIVLLLLYIALLLAYSDVSLFTTILFFTFVVYVFWDFYKTVEHADRYQPEVTAKWNVRQYLSSCFKILLEGKRESSLAREAVSVFWMLFFFGVALWAWTNLTESAMFKVLLLVLGWFGLKYYRKDKKTVAFCVSRCFQGIVAVFIAGGLLWLGRQHVGDLLNLVNLNISST
jgi:Ca2+/Na+ antiporter